MAFFSLLFPWASDRASALSSRLLNSDRCSRHINEGAKPIEKIHSQQPIHKGPRRERVCHDGKIIYLQAQTMKSRHFDNGCHNDSVSCNDACGSPRMMGVAADSFGYFNWYDGVASPGRHQKAKYVGLAIVPDHSRPEREEAATPRQTVAPCLPHKTTARSTGRSPAYSILTDFPQVERS